MIRLVQWLMTVIICAFACTPVFGFGYVDWSEPCSSDKSGYCLGHGTCRRVTSMTSYFCSCDEGFEGTRCQYRVSRVDLMGSGLVKRSSVKLSSLLRDFDLATPDFQTKQTKVLVDVASLVHQGELDGNVPRGFHQMAEKHDQNFTEADNSLPKLQNQKSRHPLTMLTSMIKASRFGAKDSQRRKAFQFLESHI